MAAIEHKVRSMSGPMFEHRNGMEIATFADASQWEAWLAAHGAERREIWMRIARARLRTHDRYRGSGAGRLPVLRLDRQPASQ